MDERIKALLVQSGLLDYTKIIVPEHEKFAKLIIKECAAEAHRRICIEGNDNMIYAHLLEHFGVEE